MSRYYVVTTIVKTEEDLSTAEVARLIDEAIGPLGGEVAWASATGSDGEQLDLVEMVGGQVVKRAVA